MICVPILAHDNHEALVKMERAGALADLLEIRLDLMERFDLRELTVAAPLPLIATYRSRRQGGCGNADNATLASYLLAAADAGAAYLDVEYGLPLEVREEIFGRRGQSQVILSHHQLNGTPGAADLGRRLRNMAAGGAEVIKIVTFAQRAEDNLTLLGLYPLAEDLGVKLVAFCMGPLGRLSRIGCIPLGGFLTFAALERGEESADGQLTVREMRSLMEFLAV